MVVCSSVADIPCRLLALFPSPPLPHCQRHRYDSTFPLVQRCWPTVRSIDVDYAHIVVAADNNDADDDDDDVVDDGGSGGCGVGILETAGAP